MISFPRDLGRIDFCSRLDLGVIWCNWISAFVTQPAYFCICCFGPQKNHKVNSDILFCATAVHTLSSMCYEVTYNLWILKYDSVNNVNHIIRYCGFHNCIRWLITSKVPSFSFPSNSSVDSISSIDSISSVDSIDSICTCTNSICFPGSIWLFGSLAVVEFEIHPLKKGQRWK